MSWIPGFKYLTKKTNDTSNEDLIDANGVMVRIYHEKQVKELCALHALNNLFQESFFSKTILDDLCIEMAPEDFINPHRSILGRGNYNINVIMKAAQLKGHEVIWFDKRRPISILNLNNIKGFILNVPSDYKIGGIIALPWERKHWYSISKINNLYYDLDSKAEKVKLIGNEEKLKDHLENILKSKEKELFVVALKEIEKNESWKY